MPNHCMNYLDVKGKYIDILKFISDTHGVESGVDDPHYKMLFEKMKPTPIKENGEIIDEWYEWRLKNWGCKWDLYDEYGDVFIGKTRISTEDDKFNIGYLKEVCENKNVDAEYSLGFCTAWAPAYPIYEWIAEKYKDLDLEFRVQYDEGGCAFAGHMEFTKGEITEDVYVDVCKDPVEYFEYLLDNDIEDIDYLLENIFDSIVDDYAEESEEFKMKLYGKIQEVMKSEKANNKGRAKLYVDICLKNKQDKLEGDK